MPRFPFDPSRGDGGDPTRGVRDGGVAERSPRIVRTAVAALLAVAVVATLAAFLGPAWAQEAAEAAGAAESAGAASSAPLAAAIATGLAAIGAGIAVGIAGAAAIGAIAEKPELLGRTLIFVGLAEGIVIYGLIVSFIILGGG